VTWATSGLIGVEVTWWLAPAADRLNGGHRFSMEYAFVAWTRNLLRVLACWAGRTFGPGDCWAYWSYRAMAEFGQAGERWLEWNKWADYMLCTEKK
jgi:hypothetical protein